MSSLRERIAAAYASRRPLIGKLVFEIVIVFVGVTAAFAIESVRRDREEAAYRASIIAALVPTFDDVLRHDLEIEADAGRKLAAFDTAIARHERPSLPIFRITNAERPPVRIWDSVVEDVLGLDGPPPKVTGLAIRNLHTGERTELRADGVFVAIGHAPATALVGDQLRRKPSGYIWTAPDSTATSVPGVFAAGDVTDETFRQAVTAAGQGCMAALEAERFLAAEEHQPAVAAE
ncbi:MAG: FAD-dependent oxidoreductase [Rhizobiales bacterium]|nr:FAD-dependent oxidoreductase [Hyphomicrobiales bacterium]